MTSPPSDPLCHGPSNSIYTTCSNAFRQFSASKRHGIALNNIYEDLRVGISPSSPPVRDSHGLTCPAHDATPGDLFVIRNIASLVPPYEPDSITGVSAALELTASPPPAHPATSWSWDAKCGGFTSWPEASRSDDEVPQHLDEPRLPRQGRGGRVPARGRS